MLAKLRGRRAAIGSAFVLGLVVGVATAGIPAVAQPIADASTSLFKIASKALKLSKAANGRSLEAIKIARNAPRGPQGEPGPQGVPATKLWAHVGAGGLLERGSGATAATNLGLGEYEVTFNQDVSQCAFEATTSGNFGFVAADPRFEKPDAAFVATRTTAAAKGDIGFNLAVFC